MTDPRAYVTRTQANHLAPTTQPPTVAGWEQAIAQWAEYLRSAREQEHSWINTFREYHEREMALEWLNEAEDKFDSLVKTRFGSSNFAHMRATVCWGSIRNRDCILYPGAGTVVKIRPAQTFYERIKVCYGATVSCDRERSIWTSRSERTPNRSTNISPGFNLSACSSILDRAVGRASRSTVMFRCRPMIVVLRLFRMFSGNIPSTLYGYYISDVQGPALPDLLRQHSCGGVTQVSGFCFKDV